jgi:peptidoglycan/LPS O-acetylase OafA/YrhL
VNRLLSWPALVPLSRLTYMAYLVHPAVIFNYYLTRPTPIYVDDLQIVSMLFYLINKEHP